MRVHSIGDGVSSGAVNSGVVAAADLDGLKVDLAAQDVSAIHRSKAEAGIEFGQAFRTLQTLRSDAGEAVGEIVLPEGVERYGPDLHPVLLDGFTVKRATRAALLSAVGGLNDLFYEVAWRERQLDAGMRPAAQDAIRGRSGGCVRKLTLHRGSRRG